LALGLVLVYLLWLGMLAAGLLSDLRALQASAGPALTALSSGAEPSGALAPLRAARMGLDRLERRLRALHGATGWWLRPLGRQRAWPWLSHRAALAEAGLSAGADLVAVAWWVSLSVESTIENDGVVNTASGLPITFSADPAGAALAALRQHRPILLRARETLAQALPREASMEGDLRAWATLSRAPLALDLLLLASSVLDERAERSLLVVLQNSDELRPTGGFVSSVARLRFVGARLDDVRYANSYDVEAYRAEHPAPPAPLRRHMGAAVLLFRDANWSPDFPSSAAVMASLYELDMQEPVDAIAVVDMHAVTLLLEALGPLDLPEYHTRVDAANLMDVAIAFWERPIGAAAITDRGAAFEDWLTHRKDLGGALVRAVLERLQRPQATDIPALLRVLERATCGKHLMFWAPAKGAQEHLLRAGWDGGLRQTEGDYLMVVDANVGWNKADRNIRRAWDYALVRQPDAAVAHLTLTYTNTAPGAGDPCLHQARYEDSYAELSNRCYWTYVRVFAPRGASLIEVVGAEEPPDLASEGGKTVFGFLVLVPLGETRSIQVSYVLPPSVAQSLAGGKYSLLIQKQAGLVGVTGGVTIPAHPEGPDSGVQWRGLHDCDLRITLPEIRR
jgi:hypothetical protein